MAVKVDLLNKLEFSILSDLGEEDRAKLATEARELVFKKGELIGKSDPPSEVFIVYRGEVSLRSKTNLIHEYGRVISGRSIELKSLFLQTATWDFAWRAEAPTRILAFPWKSVHAHLQKNKQAYDYLRKMTISVELQKLRRDLRAFGISQADTEEIISKMKLESLATLLGQNKEKLFIVVSAGRAELNVDLDSGHRPFCNFQVGDHFFFDPTNTSFALDALANCKVWSLNETQWSQVRAVEMFEYFLGAHNALFRREQHGDLEATRIGARPAKTKVKKSAAPIWRRIQYFVRRQWRVFSSTPKHVQPDQSWGGAVCIAVLGHKLGYNFGLHAIREMLAGTDKSYQLESFAKVALRLGLKPDVYKWEPGDEFSSSAPAVIMIQSRPVLLYRISGSGALVYDPEVGYKRELDLRRVVNLWDGRLILLQPTPTARDVVDPPVRFLWYLGILRGSLYTCFLMLLTSTLAFLFGLTLPMFNQYLFEHVVIEKNTDVAKLIMIGYFLCALILAILAWINKVLENDLSFTMEAKFTSAFMQHLVRLPMRFFDRFTKGDALDRFEEAKQIGKYISTEFLGALVHAVSIVLCATVMYFYHVKLLIASVCLVPLLLVITRIMAPRVHHLRLTIGQLQARDRAIIVQAFDNLDTLKSNNSFRAERWKWEANFIKTKHLMNSLAVSDGVFEGLRLLFEQGAKIWVLLIGVGLYTSGQITIGKVIASAFLIERLSTPLWSLLQTLYDFPSVKASASRVQPIFAAPSENIDLSPTKQAPIEGDIVFENVSFSYGPHAENILEDINLTIRKGEIVSLLGANGSGKTTFASLLNGTRKPTSGRILLGGRDIGKMLPHEIRAAVGTIPQDSKLFKASLFENIAMGDPTVTHERVAAAARAADADDLLARLPKGLDTLIGAGGSGLSAGQVQKIVLARMVYHNPGVFVLDESVSYLDPISQEQTMARFFSSARGKTVIIITQHIGLLSRSSKVILINNKSVVAVGPHQQLIQENKSYFEFFSRQLAVTA